MFSLLPYQPEQATTLRPIIARHERVGFSGASSLAAKWYGGFAPDIVHFLQSPSGDIVASVGLLQDELGGGLWCGGKALSGLSFTSLVVEPAVRGRGVASALNAAVVREAAKRKLAVASLFPANLELYRKAGFELVADYSMFSINPAAIRPGGDSASIQARPGRVADRDALVRLRDQLLAKRHATGTYQRDALSWQMLFQTTNEDPAEVLLFYRGEELVGYLILDMLAGGPMPTDRAIWVQDWMAADVETSRALVKAIASFGTVHQKVTWQPQASEDLAEAMVPQPTYIKPVLCEPLAARIIDPYQALAGRGYRAAANGAVRLAIDDPLLDRKYDLVLKVEGGVATVGPVKQPGIPRLSMSINALAPMLFGYRAASTLMRMGWVSGAGQAASTADVLFATERSITGDFY